MSDAQRADKLRRNISRHAATTAFVRKNRAESIKLIKTLLQTRGLRQTKNPTILIKVKISASKCD